MHFGDFWLTFPRPAGPLFCPAGWCALPNFVRIFEVRESTNSLATQPYHVNQANRPYSAVGGVDIRMTLVSEHLKTTGYSTHQSVL